jgi:hypothetical protein
MRLTTMTTRGLMVAVSVVAVALSVEGAIIVMAFLVLIRAVRRPHPVHLTTTILLTLLTGILLWANLRPTVWQEEFGGGIDAPTGLDPITKWSVSQLTVGLPDVGFQLSWESHR